MLVAYVHRQKSKQISASYLSINCLNKVVFGNYFVFAMLLYSTQTLNYVL